MRAVYNGDWSDKDDVINDFRLKRGELDDAEILYACYTYRNYSGEARVVFRRGGQLWFVSASHCSCYGLSGQWAEEAETVEALKTYRCKMPGWREFIESLTAAEESKR